MTGNEVFAELQLWEPIAAPAIETQSRSPIALSSVRSLYLSHALSTWNARSYEFAAILFTATAFPNTLLASSLRGLSNTVAALCLSSLIGTWIDESSRLRGLLLTISINRATVILACFAWFVLIHDTQSPHFPAVQWSLVTLSGSKPWLFTLILGLGIFEKLSGIGNMISMERDWVPALAFSPATNLHSYSLTHLNSIMRRIDLVCKLLAPLVVSLIITVTSTRGGIVFVGGMSLICWGSEVYCARRVWALKPQLREPKSQSRIIRSESTSLPGTAAFEFCSKQWAQLQAYFQTDVWAPSIALALLHLSVLSYSATFITFLLNSGFSLIVITIARAAGSIVEVSSTFVAPLGISHFTIPDIPPEPAEDQEALLACPQEVHEKGHAVGLARSGLWGITLQLVNLIPVVLAIWYLRPLQSTDQPISSTAASADPFVSRPVTTIIMFTFLSISRLGLWVFDLTTQEITQTRVPSHLRSSFAGTETAFVSLFELSQWAIAAIASKPEYFHWLAVSSFGAVLCSTAGYAVWVRRQRGHLLHWERIGKGCYRAKS
ncbi:hypothetical protein MMC13_008150 [Lambiella insularis]|nr:hypothetical protein [Lambiella insularis]